MLKEPISNDPNNPLISILIYEYYGEYLSRCLDSIFNQDILNNIEVIFVDCASTDGAWETARDYALRYQGIMTVKRNRRPTEHNLYLNAQRLAGGKYIVILRRDEAFLPEQVQDCIGIMEKNPAAYFINVRRRHDMMVDLENIKRTPHVNVLIHNYNYGRYLRQCLDSVLAQTYDNIGIVFSDNSSTDDSWEIAGEYARSYPEKLTLIRHRKNFGPGYNLQNCYNAIDGKYFCILCSDDVLHPDFVRECVNVMEANPETAFTMTHRSIIDEHGTPSDEPPFYNQSCVIPGPEQAAVYMMAAVNPSISQIMYRRSMAFSHLPGDSLVSRWFAQRLLDFDLCCNYPMAYIKEPLLMHRIHATSDSSQISMNLMEAFGQIILPHQFVEMAQRKENMEKAIGRLSQAVTKVSSICLRYSTRALISGEEETARRYFHLAAAITTDIYEDPVFQTLQNYWMADDAEKKRVIASLSETDNLIARTVSYDPPPSSVPILDNVKILKLAHN